MTVGASARKHGIREEESIAAASNPIMAGALDDEVPRRDFRLGFDTQGRLLEP